MNTLARCLPLLCSRLYQKIAKFQFVKNRTFGKRLFICRASPSLVSFDTFGMGTRHKCNPKEPVKKVNSAANIIILLYITKKNKRFLIISFLVMTKNFVWFEFAATLIKPHHYWVSGIIVCMMFIED